MTKEFLSPFPKLRFTDSNGDALSGGFLFTYEAGTTTKLSTYTDDTGDTANTNPIVLDSRGECSCWIPPDTAYKFVLAPSTDTDPPTNAIWTVDNITTTRRQFGTAVSKASATTTDLGALSSNLVKIIGTTTISSFGSSASTTNPIYILTFAGELTLTYNSTSLILPGAADITTAANDSAIAYYLGNGNWQILAYNRISSQPNPISTLAVAEEAGSALSNSTTATSILPTAAKITLPANYLSVGKVLRLRAMCQLSNIVTTPGTLTLDVRFGSVIAFNGGAMDLSTTAHTTLPLWVEILLTCRAIGSSTSANFMGQGIAISDCLGGTLLMPNTTPAVGTGFDSTSTNVIDLFAKFSVADTGNAITLQQYVLESLN